MEAQHTVFIGVRGGLNASKIGFRDRLALLRIRSQHYLRTHAGIVFRHYLPSRHVLQTALQLEALYVQKGYIQLFGSDYPVQRSRMDYVEIPFVTHLALPMQGFTLFTNLGGFYEQVLRIDEEVVDDFPEKYEVYPFRRNIDRERGLGIRVGLGINIRMIGGIVEAEIALSEGMQNVFRTNRLVSSIPMETRTSVWLFSMVYLLPIDRK